MIPDYVYQEINDLKHSIEKIISEERKEMLEHNDRSLKRKFELVQCIRKIYDIIDDLRRENGGTE
jgi:spore maturation protein CgeB